MKKKTSNVITYIIFLLLGFLLLWLCFRKLDLTRIWTDIKSARYSWMLLSLLCLGISLFFRALRWNILIESLNCKTRISTTYESLLIAYLANAVFPRLGEIVRCGTLAKKEKIPFDKSFGTVISERIIDLLVLFLMALLVIVFQWNLLGSLITSWFNPLIRKIKNNLFLGLFIITLIIIFIVVLVIIFRRNRLKMSQKKWYVKLSGVWHGFVEGIKSIFTMNRKGLFILYTLLIWGFYVIMTLLPFYMLDETSRLGIIEAVTLLGLATLGFVAPVPGGIGTYHFIGILLLNGFYGISETEAGSFVTINHASQMFFYLVTGGIAYLIMFFIDRRKGVNES